MPPAGVTLEALRAQSAETILGMLTNMMKRKVHPFGGEAQWLTDKNKLIMLTDYYIMYDVSKKDKFLDVESEDLL